MIVAKGSISSVRPEHPGGRDRPGNPSTVVLTITNESLKSRPILQVRLSVSEAVKLTGEVAKATQQAWTANEGRTDL